MVYKVRVRYSLLRNVAEFQTDMPNLKVGDAVVVNSSRGTESGVVVSKAAEKGEEAVEGQVLRLLAEADEKELKKIEEELAPKEHHFCCSRIKERNMPMKLAKVEHLLGSKKIIFYFLSKGRVDFRELVKDLAKECQARIEMRQIGVRDEARLLADYQHCGRELCCKTFLKSLNPVTMKMAKNQKANLEPSKISGRCGRLMCCLRYENDLYEEYKATLPKRGQTVKTTQGTGKVVDMDILAQKIIIQTDDKNIKTVPAKEIISIGTAAKETSE